MLSPDWKITNDSFDARCIPISITMITNRTQYMYTFKKLNESVTKQVRETLQKSQTKSTQVTDTGIDTNMWVMSMSGRQVSEDERSIHRKGLKTPLLRLPSRLKKA